MTIYVLAGFNNYYNRIVKRYGAVDGYQDYITYTLQGVNFVPNDGVNTQQIIGSNALMYSGAGDYVLVVNELNEIVSRWFIIEQVRDRAGQYTLTLHRDLVADYFEAIADSPMFIEKATLAADDPLIFNSENIGVNLIKSKETLIKDRSKCPWIVGYYAKDAVDLTGTVPVNTSEATPSIQLSTPIEAWDYAQYTSDNPYIGAISNGFINIVANQTKYNYRTVCRTNIFTGETTDKGYDGKTNTSLTYENFVNGSSAIKQEYEKKGLQLIQEQYRTYTNAHTTSQVNELLNYNGKLVRDSEGKYFQVRVSSIGEQTVSSSITAGSLYETLSSIVANSGVTVLSKYVYTFVNKTPNAQSFTMDTTASRYVVALERQYRLETTYNIPSSKLITTDAPWNIFAIPYGTVKVLNGNGTELVTTNADIGLSTAMSMQTQQQSKMFDVQLLPYCPLQELISAEGEITVTDAQQYSFIKDPDQNAVGIIFNVSKSVFTFDIDDIKISHGLTAIDKKLNNECTKYRLTSPNYSNYFDLSVEKNNGVQYFNIDCSYKPYTPYIHVNPNFSNLYGQDFNDPRGLILGGDFSLSQIRDQWQEYQIQNKNFQNIFDRQIQNMEVNNSIARQQERWQVAAGTVTGGASGAFAGSAIAGGNPWGTATGAILGTGLSLASGLADLKFNEQLRNEALDYTKDMFGYQLGNIKALPQTISKVSSLNPNNKIFPIIEFYTCTREERQAVASKIAYNGMTVMAIGTMYDYIRNSWSLGDLTSKGYIKGKLIRMESHLGVMVEDFHLVNSIASELDKGVYIEEWE